MVNIWFLVKEAAARAAWNQETAKTVSESHCAITFPAKNMLAESCYSDYYPINPVDLCQKLAPT
jgi:hypothetical protein